MELSDEDPVAVVRWSLSKERIRRESELAVATRTVWLRRAHWLVPLLLVIFASALATQQEIVRSGEQAKGWGFALGFVMIVSFLWALDLGVKRWIRQPWVTHQVWKSRKAVDGQEARLELSDESIRYEGPLSTGSVSWAAIEDVVMRDGDLMIGLHHSCFSIFEEDLQNAESGLDAEGIRRWVLSKTTG